MHVNGCHITSEASGTPAIVEDGVTLHDGFVHVVNGVDADGKPVRKPFLTSHEAMKFSRELFEAKEIKAGRMQPKGETDAEKLAKIQAEALASTGSTETKPAEETDKPVEQSESK